ncbi:DUF6941 family protein [Mycobacterium seoulense]|uniref:DUF6941 family protein n=1 Tax=Mycobacterium seoulense TaxID=386911 RepID=UPI0013D330DE|nr:hypothetical protein [Mycobacterium seoulense]MCV7435740.1 hypothetical protein [Mycobacterium seoulense]
MAELDYAYLAEFAQVIDGKLTAVNASFIAVTTPVPAVFQFAVAGRVRAPVEAGIVDLAIQIVAPDDSTKITWQSELRTDGHQVYDGKVGILFALRTGVPLSTHGLFRIEISIDGEHARTLAFEAVSP